METGVEMEMKMAVSSKEKEFRDLFRNVLDLMLKLTDQRVRNNEIPENVQSEYFFLLALFSLFLKNLSSLSFKELFQNFKNAANKSFETNDKELLFDNEVFKSLVEFLGLAFAQILKNSGVAHQILLDLIEEDIFEVRSLIGNVYNISSEKNENLLFCLLSGLLVALMPDSEKSLTEDELVNKLYAIDKMEDLFGTELIRDYLSAFSFRFFSKLNDHIIVS